MLKRNIKISFRVNQNECNRFKKRVKKSGLSQEAYLRQLIENLVPRESPPADYFAFMQELRAVGNNLNQIAQKAHALQEIDVTRYDEAVGEYRRLVRQITAALILPEKKAGFPRSHMLRGDKERPRSDEPFAARGESDKRREP